MFTARTGLSVGEAVITYRVTREHRDDPEEVEVLLVEVDGEPVVPGELPEQDQDDIQRCADEDYLWNGKD